jgi:ATP-dependent RNA circularization protein (DNA/RNA ligase family)
MKEDDFYKFPSTPYLIATKNQILRSDKLMTIKERDDFLSHHITVEEKIDGANLGISFDSDGNTKVQNRGGYLNKPYLGQWKKLSEWLSCKENKLFDCLGTEYILFGEWCYASHSLQYHKLPDWYIAFDIYDKKLQEFLSVEQRDKLLEDCNIVVVPKIAEGIFTLVELENFMEQKSSFANTKIEGIYLRYDNQKWLKKRAKMVRSEFVQNISEHWMRKPLEINKLHEGLI